MGSADACAADPVAPRAPASGIWHDLGLMGAFFAVYYVSPSYNIVTNYVTVIY